MLIIFISTTSLLSQLHLVLSDLVAAYCTEMELGEVHFTPQSFGKTISIGDTMATSAKSCTLWLLPKHGTGLSLAWLSVQPRLWVVDKLLQSFELSLQAAHRVSAGLLWLLCTPAGSPYSGERSPTRPPRSGPDRWRESCRDLVWRHTAAESWPHPGWWDDCCWWTGRTSDGTPG